MSKKSVETESSGGAMRALFKLAVFAAMFGFVAKLVAEKKREYMGLTESEARAKFQAKLAPRMGEERASEVADQVIPKLKERGVIKEDPITDAVGEVVDDLTDSSDDE